MSSDRTVTWSPISSSRSVTHVSHSDRPHFARNAAMNHDIALFKMGPRREQIAARVSSRSAKKRSRHQLSLLFPPSWGGARKGAGRKPSARPSTPHRARPRHRAGEPVHVTLRARLAPLRSQHLFPTIRLALLRSARRDPARFRLLHFSVQHDHVHLLVEASDKRALSSGVRSVAIRVARYVNDLLSRRGPLWGDRWFGRALTSPREVRNALVYVLANHRKHARRPLQAGIDPYSSGAWFDGWANWKPGSERAPPFSQRPTWRNLDSPSLTRGAGSPLTAGAAADCSASTNHHASSHRVPTTLTPRPRAIVPRPRDVDAASSRHRAASPRR
jgi:putative transposase